MKRVVLSVCVAVAAAVVAQAETYTWTGGTGTWNASSGAKWTASDQSTGTVPGAGDAVVIPGAATEYTVTVSEPFAVGSLVVGSSEDGFKVKVVFDNGVTTNVVSGDAHLLRGATLTHAANKYTSSGSGVAYEKTWKVTGRLSLAVDGDMTIDNGAYINVTGCGYKNAAGPGGKTSGTTTTGATFRTSTTAPARTAATPIGRATIRRATAASARRWTMAAAGRRSPAAVR